MHPLIGAGELAALLDGAPAERQPVLLDVRWQLGRSSRENRDEYHESHLPGAAFVDLETALSGEPGPGGRGGRHPAPDAARLQQALRAAGVRQDRPVVTYDAGPSLGAARAWWLLRYFGKSDVRVLDGGLAAWREAGLPVAGGEPQPPLPGDVVLRPGHRELLDGDQVARATGSRLLLDARPAERYRGEREPIDPVAGHIPGAVSLPALDLLDPDGRFLPPEALRERLAAAGVGGPSAAGAAPPVLYCGSGVQACHLALAVEHAGVGPAPALYLGSWSDWVSDPDRPVETGSGAVDAAERR